MNTNYRTPDEIERDIERERAGLTSTLDTLQEKFSVDHLVHQIGDQLRENGGDITRSVARSVKENPVALAVAGVGLAWLIFGKGRDKTEDVETRYPPRVDYDDGASSYRSRTRSELKSNGHASNDDRSYGGGQSFEGAEASRNGSFYNERHAGLAPAPRYRHQPEWARTDDGSEDSTSLKDRAGYAASAVSDAAGSAKDGVARAAASAGQTASEAASKAGSAVAGAASSVASSVSSAASSAKDTAASAGRSVADAVQSGADGVGASLSSARSSIAQGTETLSREARERVIAARERAIAARRQADAALRQASRSASDFYEDQPLVAGLLAMAAGAALAGALPRTKVEDEHLGEFSDNLMEEAERIFREETEKAKAVAKAAADEAKKVGQETKKDLDRGAPGETSAAQAIAEKVKSDTKRVAKAAKSEADRQKIGKVDS